MIAILQTFRDTSGTEPAGRQRWHHRLPSPLRAAVAALIAYGLSLVLGLPEGYWAALSALIVSRPQPGATLQAGTDRLIGTLVGAGVACGLVSLQGVPLLSGPLADWLLLAAALVLLAGIAAWHDGWRTAPVAAVIVLSAPATGHAPLAAALLRVLAIALGAGVGVVASRLLWPAHTGRTASGLSRDITDRLLSALEAAGRCDFTDSERHHRQARLLTRRLIRLTEAARWERHDKAALTALQTAVSRLNGSAGFALRALAGAARTQNPILEHPGLQQRLVQLRAVASGEAGGLAPIDGWPDAGLSGQHRLQAQALRYALALALSDVQAIIAPVAERPPAAGPAQPAVSAAT